MQIFGGLSLTLRSHDQFQSSHWSNLLPPQVPPLFFLFFFFSEKFLGDSGGGGNKKRGWEAKKKNKNASSPFSDASGKWKKKYWCCYPHRLRDLVSHIGGIFTWLCTIIVTCILSCTTSFLALIVEKGFLMMLPWHFFKMLFGLVEIFKN